MQTRDGKNSPLKDEELQDWKKEQEDSSSNDEVLSSNVVISDLEEIVEQKNVASKHHTQSEVKGEKKSILDWIDVIATATTSVATVAISLLLFLLNQQQFNNAEARQKHEIMSSYLTQMAQLQLDRDFKNLPQDREAKQMASATTLNTLRQLDGEADGEEKGQLLKFLYSANLIGMCQTDLNTLKSNICQQKIIDLRDARLDGTMFKPPMPQLPGVDLVRASLTGANLSGVDLTEAKMMGVNLNNAILAGTRLKHAEINQATLEGTNLADATLIEVNLSGSSLRKANLSGAKLQKAILTDANLQGAILEKADLRNANLDRASLQEARLSGAVYNEATIFPTGFDRYAHGMQPCTTPIEQKCESLK